MELRVRSALHRRGLRFRKDLPIVACGTRVRPDIAFTRQRLAVFLDGCFWHCCPDHGHTPKSNVEYWRPKLARNTLRDRRVDAALRKAGWRVVRVWGHDSPELAADLIVSALTATAEARAGA